MRSTADRIRHAVSFEIIGLVLVTPAGAALFDMPMHDIGTVAIVGATPRERLRPPWRPMEPAV